MKQLLQGDALEVLRTLPSESVQSCITSPPYWGLRDYGTASWEGGEADCRHEGDGRWYTEQTAASSGSAEAFSEAGEANAARLKAGRWREAGTCVKCGAIRHDRQLGLEPTPELYISKMVGVFREVKRVLRSDGTCWINIGDSYSSGGKGGGGSYMAERAEAAWQKRSSLNGWRSAPPGLKDKDLVGIPWLLAFALRADGWYLRQDIIWAKPNPMPESVTDRCTKSHEYIFLLSKSERYYYDAEAIKEPAHDWGMRDRSNTDACVAGVMPNGQPHKGLTDINFAERGRNRRSVWEIATAPYPEAHFATFPPDLVKPCILAGTSEKGCCSECGAPWKRITEPDAQRKQQLGEGWHGHEADLERGQINGKPALGGYITTGWQPTCKCCALAMDETECARPAPYPTKRCMVLDPFAGSGTVGLVAQLNHCDFIGIELNPEYILLAEKRLAQESLQF